MANRHVSAVFIIVLGTVYVHICGPKAMADIQTCVPTLPGLGAGTHQVCEQLCLTCLVIKIGLGKHVSRLDSHKATLKHGKAGMCTSIIRPLPGTTGA